MLRRRGERAETEIKSESRRRNAKNLVVSHPTPRLDTLVPRTLVRSSQAVQRERPVLSSPAPFSTSSFSPSSSLVLVAPSSSRLVFFQHFPRRSF